MTAARVRVLFLMPNFGIGGAERSLLVIARHADRAGIDMRVASVGSTRRPEAETVLPRLAELGVPGHDFGVAGRPSRSPMALAAASRRLRRLLREAPVDVVDSSLLDADLTARIGLLATPVVHVVHLVNTPYHDAVRANGVFRSGWRLSAARRVDALTAPLTDSFVAITAAVATQGSSDLRLGAGRVTVVPRGVDLHQFDTRPVYTGPFTPTRPLRLLAVGRLVPQKGHAVLLEAVAELRRRGRPVELTIAGEGPLAASLARRRDALGLGSAVTIEVQPDVRPALEACDVFVFPSLWEGQGNALLEAMAMGRPIVASDVPAIREVLADAAILAPPGDPLALAAALSRAADRDPEPRRDAGRAVRLEVEARYQAGPRVTDLADHYRLLLGLAASTGVNAR